MKIKSKDLVDYIELEATFIVDEITGDIIDTFDEYNKDVFNANASTLSKKGKRFFYGTACVLLEVVRRFDLTVDQRCWNLLRHIEDTFGPKDSSKAY